MPYYMDLRQQNNMLSESCPIKQASLRSSARSLIERTAGPLGNLNKGHTERTSRPLTFNASYACTSMHECDSLLFLTLQSQTIHTHQWSQSLIQPGSGPSWAHSPYLQLENVSKGEDRTRKK